MVSRIAFKDIFAYYMSAKIRKHLRSKKEVNDIKFHISNIKKEFSLKKISFSKSFFLLLHIILLSHRVTIQPKAKREKSIEKTMSDS